MSRNKRDLLTPSEISAFCAQMSMILKSGIALTEGVEIMFDDAGSPGGREILGTVLEELEKGAPLYVALSKSGKFPDYMLTMVEIGEAAGRLENVMDSLTSFYEREEAVSRAVRSAITYPLVMIVMMLAVITILVVQVMPIFNEVFQGLGAQMTGFSLAVMNFGEALGRYSFAVLGIVVCISCLIDN